MRANADNAAQLALAGAEGINECLNNAAQEKKPWHMLGQCYY